MTFTILFQKLDDNVADIKNRYMSKIKSLGIVGENMRKALKEKDFFDRCFPLVVMTSKTTKQQVCK